jgi:hypothetical protein
VSELRIGEIADRLIEIRVVEDVEGFRAELEGDMLGYGHVLR